MPLPMPSCNMMPPVDSVHKGPVMWQLFPCHDVIIGMCSHRTSSSWVNLSPDVALSQSPCTAANGRQFACHQGRARRLAMALKDGRNSHQSYEPIIHCHWGNLKLYSDQTITIWGLHPCLIPSLQSSCHPTRTVYQSTPEAPACQPPWWMEAWESPGYLSHHTLVISIGRNLWVFFFFSHVNVF